MLSEPAILVILNLNVFVHDVRPFLEVLKLVLFDLGRTTTTSVILLGNFMLFRLVDGSVVGIALLLSVDQIDNFQHLMLNVVLVYEC